MPPRKRSEPSLATIMRRYRYFAYKWRDRGFMNCPHCHRMVINCPHCHKKMLLPKAKKPDYLVATQWAYVECKQGGDTWSLWDFSEVQEEVLSENEKYSRSWVFLELGEGRAPNGRSAWLIPWLFLCGVRIAFEEQGHKSVRFEATSRSRVPVAKEVFQGFELAWKHGGWTIPDGHTWWGIYAEFGRPLTEEEIDEQYTV